MPVYPPIHRKTPAVSSFDRLEMLWERYPKYRERQTFSTLEELLEDHESYQKDFDDVRDEYEENHYERFLVQLSWADLPYRYATMELIQKAPDLAKNPYVEAFLGQFAGLDTDRKACFIFPESYISQFFVITEVCKRTRFPGTRTTCGKTGSSSVPPIFRTGSPGIRGIFPIITIR